MTKQCERAQKHKRRRTGTDDAIAFVAIVLFLFFFSVMCFASLGARCR
jgi:hypothetical protein